MARQVLTNAQMQAIINAGQPVIYKGQILKTIAELPSDGQILLDYPEYAYNRIEGNAKAIIGYQIVGTPTDGQVLTYDGTNKYFTFGAGGGGGGGTPGGSDGQVQYKNGSSFAGSSGITLTSTQATLVSPLIAKLGNLTSNGFVKTSGGDGTLSIDTSNYITGLTVAGTSIASGNNGRVLYNNSGTLGEYQVTGTGNVVLSASPTISGTLAASNATLAGTLVQTSNSATAFESGPNGSTNPVFRLVNNVASQATGLSITGNAAGSGVTLAALSIGTNEPIILQPKGIGAGFVRITDGTDRIEIYPQASGVAEYGTSTNRPLGFFVNNAGDTFRINSTLLSISSSSSLGWTSSGSASNTHDTSLRRHAAGVIRVGDSTTGAGSLLLGTSAGSIGSSGAGVIAAALSTAPANATDTSQAYSIDFNGSAGDARWHFLSEAGNPIGLGNNSIGMQSPIAANGASQAGRAFTVFSSGATASLDTAGAAAGGDLNLLAGPAARLTSGNANGGNIVLTTGAGIGTGTTGQVFITNVGTSASPSLSIGNVAVGINVPSGFGSLQFVQSSSAVAGVSIGFFTVNSGAVIGFSNSSTNPNGTIDWRLYRSGAGIARIGGSTTSDAGGLLIGASTDTGSVNTLTLGRSGIGTTSTDGIILVNNTAATVGAQQYSPRLRLTGQGWKTNATAASQTVDWVIENQPVQGAANPTTLLNIGSVINATQGTGISIAGNSVGSGAVITTTSSNSAENLWLLAKGSGGTVIVGNTTGGAQLLQFGGTSGSSIYSSTPTGDINFRSANNMFQFQGANGSSFPSSSSYVELSGAVRFYGPAAATLRIGGNGSATTAGNLILGTSAGAIGTSGAGVLAFTLSTEPSSSPTDTTQLYSKDFSAGDHRLYLRNEAASSGSPVATLGDVQTFTGKITFSPSASVAGINVGSVSGDPSTPTNGDLWYDSTGQLLRARINGATVSLGAGGGGSAANPTASVGLTAVNGSASTFMRSDAAPPLDQAITPTWTGAHIWNGITGTFRRDNIGTTSTDGLIIENSTTTTGSGLNQWSPRLRFRGTGWKTAATAGSQTVDYALEVQTSDEVASPNSEFVIRYSVNGGAYTNLFRLSRTSTITLSSGAVITGTSFQTEAGGAGFRVNNRARLISPATGVWQLYGDQASTSATLSSVATSPTQITADQNNYAPGVAWFIRLTSDASRNITGIVAGQDGQVIELWNVGSNNIVLQNENASSTAGNRFLTNTGADLTIVPNNCAKLRYDLTTARWRAYLA